MLVKGVYKIMTFGQYLETFEGKNTAGFEYISGSPWDKSRSSSSAINKVYAYRESVMRSQTPENAAKTLINSSKAIGSSESIGRGYDKAASYIDSKLSSMSPNSGFKYLSGKK
jgi:hypothetical protein